MAGVALKLKRFDRVAGNFPIVVKQTVRAWQIDPTENAIRLAITSKFTQNSRGLLRASVRSDIKGGAKKSKIGNPRKKGSRTVESGTLIARFLAGSGDSIQDKVPPVPYATQRERGGIITPRTAQAVTIPIGGAPRDGAKVLRDSGRGVRIGDIIFERIGQGKDATLTPRYILKRNVAQKPKPYMEPAVRENLPELRKDLKAINNKKLGIRD